MREEILRFAQDDRQFTSFRMTDDREDRRTNGERGRERNMKKVISAGHICLDMTPVFPAGKPADDLASLLVPGRLVQVEAADVHTGGSVANTGLAGRTDTVSVRDRRR